jgi:hypothetical protein
MFMRGIHTSTAFVPVKKLKFRDKPDIGRATADRTLVSRGLGSALAFVALAMAVCPSVHASGLTITPTFDTTILSDPNSAAIIGTIDQAISIYESLLADPINVNITFKEGDGLGSSSTAIAQVPYSLYLSHLAADATTSNDAIALASLPNQTTDPVLGQSNIWISSANARALGFIFNPGTDGTITLNTSIMNLTRPDADSSKYDLLAITMHEIDEVLGMGSGLNIPSGSRLARPQDLFRYNGNGSRSFTTSSSENAYFSIDGGATSVVAFNQNGTGDYGDWASGSGTVRVQDAYGTPGAMPNLGVELVNLDVIGYDLSTPEPAPMLLTAAGLGLLVLSRRRVGDRRRVG